MKRTLLLLFVLGAFLTSGIATANLMAQGVQGGVAPAQQVTNPPAGVTPSATNQQQQTPTVMVVDYLYLMDIHPKLYAESNALLQNRQKMQNDLQAEQQQLQTKSRELNGFDPGTEPFTKKREELYRLQADLESRAINASEKFQLDQLTITYNAYLEIKYYVDLYAKRFNAHVVLNHIDVNRRLPKEQSPESRSMEMEQIQLPVAWIHSQLDLTPYIEQTLNETHTGNGKNYQKVDYAQVKEQRFNGGKPSVGGTQPPINVALPNSPVRN